MVERVKKWIDDGVEVRIMTARFGVDDKPCSVENRHVTPEEVDQAIGDWTEEHCGKRLRCTCVKDMHMIELWDDRAVQVVANTGRTLAEEHEAELSALRGAP